MIWLLFKTFFITGLVSFGGGYAIVPVIEAEVVKYGWMSTQKFTDIIAIAGMSPGPIATNTAIFIGYQMSGIVGAAVSALAMVLPSLLLVILVALFFYKLNHNRIVQSAFYGLRPVVIGLIVFAAIKFSLSTGVVAAFSLHTLSLIAIFVISLFLLIKRNAHPAYVIVMAGLIGMAFYS